RRVPVDSVFQADDRHHMCFAKSRSGFNQRVEYGLQIEGRAADDLENVGGGGLLLQRLAQLVEQAGVLDRYDGLGGEIRDKLDVFIAKWPHLGNPGGSLEATRRSFNRDFLLETLAGPWKLRVGRSIEIFCSRSLPTSKSTGRPRLKRCVSNSLRP